MSEVYINSLMDLEEELQVEKKHRSQFFLARGPGGQYKQTEYVFVVFHGLSMSPMVMSAVANRIHSQGHNVLSLRLANHFENPRKKLDSVTYQQWLDQVDEVSEHIHLFGKKVIFVGHSTGSLMSIYGAFKNKDTIAGLFLMSPAIKLTWFIRGTSALFRSLRISGQLVDNLIPFHTPKKYDSTYAEVQVRGLSDYINKEFLNYNFKESTFLNAESLAFLETVPIWVLDTESDMLVDVYTNTRLFDQIASARHRVIVRDLGVMHNKIMYLKRFFKSTTRDLKTHLSDFLQSLK